MNVTHDVPRPLDIDDQVLTILQEMTRISAAYKAWRGAVTDVLNDNRCFNSTPQAGGKWRVMVKALFDTDKAALSDLLGEKRRCFGRSTFRCSSSHSEDHHCSICQHLHQPGIRNALAVAKLAATVLRAALRRKEPFPHAAAEYPREAGRYTAQCLCSRRAV